MPFNKWKIENGKLRVRIPKSQISILNSNGFTLIELLVVLSVIGILATLTLASFGGTQERARDSKRKQEIDQIKKALILYNENVGNYPGEGTTCDASTSSGSWSGGAGCDLDTLLQPKYMTNVPTDPLSTATNYYGYSSNSACAAGYGDPIYCNSGKVVLYAFKENNKDQDRGDAALFGYTDRYLIIVNK